ncbi:hypothetical protein ACXDF8_12880 [Mycolicibacterium sp. CBM1]
MFGSQQYKLDWIVSDLMYLSGTLAVLIAIVGVVLIDLASTRPGNVRTAMVQKMIAAAAGGFGMFLVGYPIWQLQFNEAFGVDHPLLTAMKDWWMQGSFARVPSSAIDPAALPEADVMQIFLVFFVTFGMLAGVLLEGALGERIKPLPLYITSFLAGAVGQPIVAYLLWGSLSPLTTRGFHDYVAVTSLYIFVGVLSLVFNIKMGARLGRFAPHADGVAPADPSPVLAGTGMLLLMFAIPFIVLGSGYLVPGVGYYGISFTSSGIGLVLSNTFAAFLGGGVTGGIIAYRRRELLPALVGPLFGYVMCGTILDVSSPLVCFVVALFGPVLFAIAARALAALKIDDAKLAPLALGPGVLGVVVGGFLTWGARTGGYPDLTGRYALQSATITPWMQILGVSIAVAIPAVSGWLLATVLGRTTGLRISEADEVLGQDEAAGWTVSPYAAVVDAAPIVPQRDDALTEQPIRR